MAMGDHNGPVRGGPGTDDQIDELVRLGSKYRVLSQLFMTCVLTTASQLFAGHIFTHTLPATADFNPAYYVAGKNEDTGAYIFKAAVYNSTDGADVPVLLNFDGVAAGATAELTVLTGPEDPYGWNDPFTGVNVVATTKTTLTADDAGAFAFSLPNLSVAVLDTGAVSNYTTRAMKFGKRD